MKTKREKVCPNKEAHPNRVHGPEQKLHSCPYQEDINNDKSLRCNCCEQCVQECVDEI